VTKVTPAKGTKKAAKAKDDTVASKGPDVGDSAPSFVLQDHTGTMVSSESLRGSNYVLYFYPKDDTPGCTLEACGFRDETPRFTAKGVKVLGVSPDSPEAHTRFRKKYDLSFPLLSDPEKTLAKAYGVWVKKQNYGREYMGVERSTFFVDRHGVIKKVWRKVRVPGHVDEVLHSV
jgi:peroxiredoxin Q/BCP